MIQGVLPYTTEARKLARELRNNMTPCEHILWNKIKKKQVKVQFFRQFPILEYIVDFYTKEIGLAIEIDGSSHDNMMLEDSLRQGRIEKLGVQFIRFTNQEIETDIEHILYKLSKTIDECLVE